MVLSVHCEQSACISNCGQCKQVGLPQRLVEVYGLNNWCDCVIVITRQIGIDITSDDY